MATSARPLLLSAALALAACGSGSSSPSSAGPSGSDPSSPGGSGTEAQACAHPVWSSDDPHEDVTLPSGYTVFNNVWSGEGGPQSIHVCSEKSWYVVTNQPVIQDNRGSIKSYPCSKWDLGGLPLSSFASIVSTYGDASPASGVWNAAYDIWLGSGGWDVEVMVWNDYRYPAPLPPGDAQDSDTATIDGQTYYAWTRSGGSYIALAMNPMHTSGSIEFRHVFDWLVQKGWLKKDIPIHWFEYGIEIGETGTPMTFAVTDFSVTARTR